MSLHPSLHSIQGHGRERGGASTLSHHAKVHARDSRLQWVGRGGAAPGLSERGEGPQALSLHLLAAAAVGGHQRDRVSAGQCPKAVAANGRGGGVPGERQPAEPERAASDGHAIEGDYYI